MFKLNNNFLVFKKKDKLKNILGKIKKFILKIIDQLFLLLMIKINVLVL